MAKTKLIVTGSGGFILSNFVRHVLKDNSKYEIISIDNCKNKSVLNTIYSNKGHKLHVGDVADSHFIDVIFELEKPDYVIHGAACSFVDHSLQDPNEFVRSNVLGTQVIINACLKHKVKKLVQVSTDEVYGHLISEKDASWKEDAPLNPRNAYSATKASAELLVRAAGETHGLKYNITRSCNNYGPRQPRRNLIPVIIANILDGKSVPIYGKGEQIRDWIHVQDHCSALLHVLENAPDNETYNVASNQEFSNIEVFHEICNAFKTHYNVDAHNLLTFVKDRPGHDFRYSVDSTKLKQLGWSPTWKFKDGIVQTLHWYNQNKWFIK